MEGLLGNQKGAKTAKMSTFPSRQMRIISPLQSILRQHSSSNQEVRCNTTRMLISKKITTRVVVSCGQQCGSIKRRKSQTVTSPSQKPFIR